MDYLLRALRIFFDLSNASAGIVGSRLTGRRRSRGQTAWNFNVKTVVGAGMFVLAAFAVVIPLAMFADGPEAIAALPAVFVGSVATFIFGAAVFAFLFPGLVIWELGKEGDQLVPAVLGAKRAIFSVIFALAGLSIYAGYAYESQAVAALMLGIIWLLSLPAGTWSSKAVSMVASPLLVLNILFGAGNVEGVAQQWVEATKTSGVERRCATKKWHDTEECVLLREQQANEAQERERARRLVEEARTMPVVNGEPRDAAVRSYTIELKPGDFVTWTVPARIFLCGGSTGGNEMTMRLRGQTVFIPYRSGVPIRAVKFENKTSTNRLAEPRFATSCSL